MKAVLILAVASTSLLGAAAPKSLATDLLCKNPSTDYSELHDKPYRQYFRFSDFWSRETGGGFHAYPKRPMTLLGARVIEVVSQWGEIADGNSWTYLRGDYQTTLAHAQAFYGRPSRRMKSIDWQGIEDTFSFRIDNLRYEARFKKVGTKIRLRCMFGPLDD